MKHFTLAFLLLLAYSGYAQVTDSLIVSNLFGHKTSDIEKVLDSLGVYYHVHYIKNNNEKTDVVISIAIATDNIKVYTLNATRNGTPEKIVVKFEHGNYKHMKDLDHLKGFYTKHIGHYSTDVTFYSVETIKSKFPTRKFLEYQYASTYANKVPSSAMYSCLHHPTNCYYVGIYQSEDKNFIYFIDGMAVSKNNLIKVK